MTTTLSYQDVAKTQLPNSNLFRDSSEDSIIEEDINTADDCDSDGEVACSDEATLRVLLLRERSKLMGAKETIASLVEQITQYKELVEEEKSILETKLNEERITKLELYQILKAVESEKDTVTKQLDTVIKECGQLEQEKQTISKDNINNLQSLMEEISGIEENNDALEKSLDAERAKCKLLEKQLSEQLSINHKLQSVNTSLGDNNALESMRRQVAEMQTQLTKEKEKMSMADHYLVQARKSLGLTTNITGGSATVDIQELTSLKTNLEEERKQLTRTQMLLEEEKKRSELNKRSSDNMVSRIRDLIASHHVTLQQLDDEKENVKLMTTELDRLRQQTGQSINVSNNSTPSSMSPHQQPSKPSLSSIENLRISGEPVPTESSSRQMLYKSIIRNGALGQENIGGVALEGGKGKLSKVKYTSNNSPVILERKQSISTISFKQSKKLEKEIKEISRKIQQEEEEVKKPTNDSNDEKQGDILGGSATPPPSLRSKGPPKLVKRGSSFFDLVTRRPRSSSSSELVNNSSSATSKAKDPSAPKTPSTLSRASGAAVSSQMPPPAVEKASPTITRKKSFWRISSK
ncbi:hypothetical protein SAMD00019534_073690 [Acytostelium subglobosum LB1]|uniref:hypothetical protein n=1 Tax=Acytostelium subglobosum LB1 TaxID=1410327 RepID=UPI000644D2BF|nr:hypothetical protein SAMD00019534_073690 [Acytostelium subglobosum LB1]GAM24194.1 hypothetical protein SAMD00019534_073690 [Acytostelium subglobosum LB1]|eukprot:XP_012752520.1 hypothetical protein SAMD00019534_073690 [Acytostelium subglobosum LB1]